jgi:hypothetical protein
MADAEREHWFDAGPLLAARVRPSSAEGPTRVGLAALRAARPVAAVRRWWTAEDPLQAFAAANGLRYVRSHEGAADRRERSGRPDLPGTWRTGSGRSTSAAPTPRSSGPMPGRAGRRTLPRC